MDDVMTTIDQAAIAASLQEAKAGLSTARVEEILAKAGELKGLSAAEVAVLMEISDPELLAALFATARDIKDTIYGRRLVIFAPLYVSNLCANECVYCAFRARNAALARRALRHDEISAEVEALVAEGHKRVLLVAGEAYPREGFDFILDAIAAVYAVRRGSDAIRRVNVNIAPLDTEQFTRLKGAGIGTYQLFQETYHPEVYAQVHLAGRKRDYAWRLAAMDRAMAAGIDDVGIGVLFGLADWRFEILAMMQHIAHLERRWGVGPHTISVPRLEPANGSDLATHPPHAVDDIDFRKIVAILRLAVPYTGIIMSTRETPHIRRETFALGVSQISAGSRTNPGGYSSGEDEGQFSLGDHRSLDEVIADVASLGYVPSFCTACYRMGRTGQDFMDMAKPGAIKAHCDPNALVTFLEYLLDHASQTTRDVGEGLITRVLADSDPAIAARVGAMLEQVRAGKRDVLC